ncbi:MAG: ABC transporter substrate-binding protein [Dehalococcoidia bacterium]
MFAAYAAACGSKSSSTKSAANSSVAAGSPQAKAQGPTAGQGTPVPIQLGTLGGKLRVAVTLAPGTLDAHLPVSGGDTVYLSMLYDGLITNRHFLPDPNFSLAEKWEIVDPTTIVFHLRQGVQFHDGTPFNADAVKWNLTRILDPATKSVGRSYLTDVDHVETPDQSTVCLILKQPNATLIYFLGGVYGVGMVSPTAQQKSGKEFGSKPVGTGPFSFVEWASGSHVTVKRNPNYWLKDSAGKQLPYLDEVTITAIPDDTVRFANLQTGAQDMAGINNKDLPTARADKNLNVIAGVPGIGVPSVVVFNVDKPPADNINLRKAIAYALDPGAVGKVVYFGLAEPADDGMITPGSWGYAPRPGRPKFDVNQAKQFLKDGGKPDGFEFTLLTYASPTISQQTELYQGNLAKVGIKANIMQQDVSTATTTFFTQGGPPVFSTSWGGTSPEPNGTCSIVYSKDAFYNPMKHAVDPQLDDLIAKGRQTYDLSERKKYYSQINQIVLDNAYFVPMLYSTGYGIFRKNVQNAALYYDWGFNWLTAFWLKG